MAGRSFLLNFALLFFLLLTPPSLLANGLSETRFSAVSSRNVSSVFPELPEYLVGTADVRSGSLFEREAPGWDFGTVERLYRWVISIPVEIPRLLGSVLEQSRVIGAVGSLLLLMVTLAALYSAIARKRIASRVEAELWEMRPKVPWPYWASFLSIVGILTAVLFPLALFAIFYLVGALIQHKAAWLELIKKLTELWIFGTILIQLLRAFLVGNLLTFCPRYGKTLLRLFSVVILYVLGGKAALQVAGAVRLPHDMLSFLQFALTLSAVLALGLIGMKKYAVLSLFPVLPYRVYRGFMRFIDRFYFPLAFLTFLTGLLWCAGYRNFCIAVWARTWGAAGAFVLIVVAYHFPARWLRKKSETTDENAQLYMRSLRNLLLYVTLLTGFFIILKLFEVTTPLRQVTEAPLFHMGETPVSSWVFIQAGLIIATFMLVSRLVQAYFEYKVYPSVGIEVGLAFALDTLIRYLFLLIGILIALRAIGIDLRVLMVFAGAAGIGAGLGLQSIAANFISGLSIVFGRKFRKGDWVKVGDTIGMITNIYLRATQVWTRDNIEYIIPNTELISKTAANLTLNSPWVRIHIPIGVSYNSKPSEVQKILIESAEKHSMATQHKKPLVWLTELGESSVNYELLVWIDIRKTSERAFRSLIYFSALDALARAGIEIPYPQRDLHVRSGLAPNLSGGMDSSGREPSSGGS